MKLVPTLPVWTNRQLKSLIANKSLVPIRLIRVNFSEKGLKSFEMERLRDSLP